MKTYKGIISQHTKNCRFIYKLSDTMKHPVTQQILDDNIQALDENKELWDYQLERAYEIQS